MKGIILAGGSGFTKILKKSVHDVVETSNAKVFGYYVNNPKRYGVVENDKYGKVISIEESHKGQKVTTLLSVYIFIQTLL